jgi:hypothetical protein
LEELVRQFATVRDAVEMKDPYSKSRWTGMYVPRDLQFGQLLTETVVQMNPWTIAKVSVDNRTAGKIYFFQSLTALSSSSERGR